MKAGSRIDTSFVREMATVTRRLYLGGSGFSLATADQMNRSDLGIRGVLVGVMDIIRDSVMDEGSEYDEGSVLVDQY